jgi:hypothetical protein
VAPQFKLAELRMDKDRFKPAASPLHEQARAFSGETGLMAHVCCATLILVTTRP